LSTVSLVSLCERPVGRALADKPSQSPQRR
jgi:hypothetical protein